MLSGVALLTALLLVPGSPGDAPSPATAGEQRERALALLRAGAPDRVLAEAADGPAALRCAALEALGTLTPGTAPAGTIPAAASALASEDGLLRRAAVSALLAAGPAAERALESIVEGKELEGAPGVPRGRAADALFDLRRAGVEEEFLTLWGPNDGSFRGMFAPLRARGPVAARVLAAIALDRRMAGRAILSFGPYSWIRPPRAEQDRSETRYRALDALEDAGDAVVREILRKSLRPAPAPDLYDDSDPDPIPASLDDGLRKVIASLGDPEPLWQMIQVSERNRHEYGSAILEMRRRAGAFSTLAENTPVKEIRLRFFDAAEDLWRNSTFRRRQVGMPVDGVDAYNLACILARRDRPGDREQAVSLLDRSLDTYAVTSDWVARDGDLANLRGEPRWAGLLQRLRVREAAMKLPPAEEQPAPAVPGPGK